jgi:hypothetical protein
MMIITKGLMYHPFEKLRAWICGSLYRIRVWYDELHSIGAWYNKELHKIGPDNQEQ